jgi:cytochrome c
MGCHRVGTQLVGPSFMAIAQRYKDDEKSIVESIKNGTKEKWEGSRTIMPAFKEIKDKDFK